jgi:hypothetical protein
MAWLDWSFLRMISSATWNGIWNGNESGENAIHHFSGHICQAKVPAGVAVGKFRVVKSELVEESCVEIVNVDAVFDCVHTQFIGGTVGQSTFYTASGKEHGKPGVVMVATGFCLVLVFTDLGVWRASKFASPDDKGFIE